MQVQETAVQTDRVLTIPNLLSLFRLIAIPVFLWLVLSEEADVAAGVLLMASAATDWLDGVVARRTHSISSVGRLLDPLADRLTTLAVLVALALRDLIPWWLVVLLLARDVVLTLTLLVLRRRGIAPLDVAFVGKAATASLLTAFPALLFGTGDSWFADLARAYGWATLLWGLVLYWWSAAVYLREASAALRAARIEAAS